MATWIKTSDRMPELGQPVLVWDGQEQAVAHWKHGRGVLRPIWWVHNTHGFCEDGEIFDVTHWSPLDPPPS